MAFIVFEGPDGSGKDTVADIVRRFLISVDGHPPVHLLQDPGSTDIGEMLRKYLKDGRKLLGLRTQLLGFLAARAALLEENIMHDSSAVYLCRRFDLSTFVYQGSLLPEGLNYVRALNDLAVQGLPKPDLYVVLTASDSTLDRRVVSRVDVPLDGMPADQDRFEAAKRQQILDWRLAYRNCYGLLTCPLFGSFVIYDQFPEETPWDVTAGVLPSIMNHLWLKDTPWRELWCSFREANEEVP